VYRQLENHACTVHLEGRHVGLELGKMQLAMKLAESVLPAAARLTLQPSQQIQKIDYD
jgi:hypothetical protein